MKLWSDSFQDGAAIPGEYAFCVIDPASHVRLSSNKNPHFEWSGVPEGTQSFALLCHDPDVPSKGDDVNQEGKTVPANLPRVDFYHWSLFDMPPNMLRVVVGAFSDGVTARGKSGPECLGFMRHGINDYTGWFANDLDMSGDYYGYDGPCPPWNDALLHHYVFTLYALDIAQLPEQGKLSGAEVRAALEGHILAQASITGTYTLNPALASN
jgi:Raf kinase inhibitor-like YbhB/YbcL family protein